ncbi:hypothetical protein ABG768_016121 [Culter alburnus]|uniref:Uncharacterized protein n=1 Tax=Culter alburnus TaxID=194366 RepID=A0AAW1Z1C2_CULAL
MSHLEVDEVLSLVDQAYDPDPDPDSETENPNSPSTETIQTASHSSVRRSVRLAQRQVSINDWPVHKILEYLFNRNITPKTGLSHQELFALFLSVPEIATSQLPPPPPSSPAPAKAKAKRKNITPPAATLPAKRSRSDPLDDNDPVLSVLLQIRDSIGKLENRVSTLEKNSPSPSTSSAPPTDHPTVSSCIDSSPRHTLASALPAPPNGDRSRTDQPALHRPQSDFMFSLRLLLSHRKLMPQNGIPSNPAKFQHSCKNFYRDKLFSPKTGE